MKHDIKVAEGKIVWEFGKSLNLDVCSQLLSIHKEIIEIQSKIVCMTGVGKVITNISHNRSK